jgi:hypothetical protein
MLNILATSIARAGGIEVPADRRIVPAPEPAADHSAALFSALARGATALAAILERRALTVATRRRVAAGTC